MTPTSLPTIGIPPTPPLQEPANGLAMANLPPDPPRPDKDHSAPSRPGRHGHFKVLAVFAGGVIGAVVICMAIIGVAKVMDDRSVSAPLSAAETPVTTVVTASTVDPPTTAEVSPASDQEDRASSTLGGQPLDIHEVIAAVQPSVVAIEIGQQVRDGNVSQVAAGSGVVISNDGLILTNAHVVAPTDSNGRTLADPVVTIRLADGVKRSATLLGASPAHDIAVIRVGDTSELPAATLGESASLQVGDDVVAIGNALDLGATPTVTKGIVSALDRTLDIDATTSLSGLIQIDASINHGNSGGALANAAGEVIGINSAGIPGAENVGFAIAMDTVKPLIEQLRVGNGIPAEPVAFLGVSTQQTVDGITVTGVTSGSGADVAGLEIGDVIIGIDGTSMTVSTELGSALRAHEPGDSVQIAIDRNESAQTFTAVLGSRSE